MKVKRVCLGSKGKLVEAMADWLLARVCDTAEGAKSLGHLMVLVPTAQAGRNLRFTLAKKAAEKGWGGILPPRAVSPAWRPCLPDEVPLKKDKEGRSYLSPSAIDTYLDSPLKYLLRYGLGMRDRYEEKKELGFDDYGTFVHRVLEIFANEQKERPLSTEAEIGAALKRIIDQEVKCFGPYQVGRCSTISRRMRSAKTNRRRPLRTVFARPTKARWRRMSRRLRN